MTIADDAGGAWRALTEPRRIALVGASERNPFARNLVSNMARLGYRGEIQCVNPQRATAFDRPCYPDLAALPAAPDCVAITVPAAGVLSVVAQGLSLGVRAFIVNSSGFAEVDDEGREHQLELRRMCEDADAYLLGPNCMGLVNVSGAVAAFGAPLPLALARGSVAVVSQSGSAAIAVVNAARSIGFTYVASTGNEAVLTAEDVIAHCVSDAETRVMVVFVEAIRRPERFLELARSANALGKVLLVLKVGRSRSGAAAAITHTGALVGTAAVHEAVFRDAGVVQVHDLDELVEAVELFAHVRAVPAGGRTAIVGLSGGEVALAADIADSVGLPLAELSADTAARIAAEMDRKAPIRNPVDLGLGFRTADFEESCARVVTALSNDPAVDIVAVAQDAARDLNPEQVPLYARIARGTARGAAASRAPVVFLTHVSAGLHDEIAGPLHDAGVPVLQGARPALRALAHLGRYGERRAVRPGARPVPDPAYFAAALRDAGGARALRGERAAKQLLAAYGVPVTRERLATTPAEARAEAQALGFPVVLKVESPDILHKTDVDGVRLGLRTAEDVERAFADIVAAVERHRPGARLDGVVVAEQIDGGVEIFVGVQRDAQFGPIMAIGLGGVFVESLGHPTLALPPSTEEAALVLLESFPGHAVLRGVRGRPACDLPAAAAALVRIGRMAIDAGPILDALDVNPFVVGPAGRGAHVLDARIVLLGEPR